jgi:hypothetical protein
VHPDDWWLRGLGWRATWRCDQFHPFGYRTSPAIFDLFTSALEWILQTHQRCKHTLPYLSDVLAIFPHSAVSDAPNRYKGDFSQICSDPGIRVKEEKNEEGHYIRFLGIEIDTEAMEARLPPGIPEKATALVNSTLGQNSVTHRSLEMTMGFLSLACKVVPASGHFLRRLNDTLTVTSQTYHIRVSSEIKKDLTRWQTFLLQWNGIRLQHHPRQILRVWTDASGQKGIGG